MSRCFLHDIKPKCSSDNDDKQQTYPEGTVTYDTTLLKCASSNNNANDNNELSIQYLQYVHVYEAWS